MLGLWLLVLGLYLLIHLVLTFNPYYMKGGKHQSVCLEIWICQWAQLMQAFCLAFYRVHKDPQDEPIQT